MEQYLPDSISFTRFEKPGQLCPNCHKRGMTVFYSLKDIPVHSCLLLETRQEAMEYPTGNLQLGFCHSCGFISNTVYDEGHRSYSEEYEETQGFSPRFMSFARHLAGDLIANYDIRHKTILEIGCGKGDFLALMCEMGENRGIGIDPAYVPQRNPDKSHSRVEFIQDYYSPKYSHLQADVILCRHTLEHIAPTREFVQMVRAAIGDRQDVLVIFELPDVMRELKEGAYWDIYYEHCSYFSSGSLARLFRGCSFDIEDLYLEYDNQYLILTARPSGGPTTACLPQEDDLAELERQYLSFADTCETSLSRWYARFQEFRVQGRKVVIWGSGSKCVSFLTTLKLNDVVDYVVDINPFRHEKFMPQVGGRIVAPEFLRQYQPDTVVIMNPIYRQEIQKMLDDMQVPAELLAV